MIRVGTDASGTDAKGALGAETDAWYQNRCPEDRNRSPSKWTLLIWELLAIVEPV